MLRVNNWWSLAGGILFVIIIYNLWSRGSVTVSVFGGFQRFIVDTIKALEVRPE